MASEKNDIKLEASWKKILESEFEHPYWKPLTDFVREEYSQKVIYPPPKDIFRSFEMCPFNQVKVVIVGQDPYHGKDQANGLSFAVHEGVTIPPSLQNIFKEIRNDLGLQPVASGDLSRWAKQGVLLLNSVLSVQAGKPASHKGRGWEQFTDAVILRLSERRKGLVYLLWGKYAQEKGKVIDRNNNLVLESGHPSPYSAHTFYGKQHFSQCNSYLSLQGMDEIDWK